MPDSQVVTLMRQFKASLLRGEQAQTAEMARRWLGVERRLSSDMTALAYEMDGIKRDGGTVSQEMLMTNVRYRELLVQLQGELEGYTDYAERTISDRQRQLARLGIKHGEQAIRASGIQAGFNRLPVEAVENLAGFAGDGTPLRALLTQSWPLSAHGLTQELVNGVALGYNPRKVARNMANGMRGTQQRMEVIARTEIMRTYNESSRQAYISSGVIDGYARIAAHDSRTCFQCIALEGTTYKLDEIMPTHPNCVIEGTTVLSPSIVGTSKRAYNGLVFEIATERGNHLTVTPNHPVLTDKGWIAACLLKEGNNVISSRDSNGTALFVAPNNQYGPSVIEDIVEAFSETLNMLAVSVPVTAEDFHGDGMGSDVAIVRADSFLQSGFDATLIQPNGELPFFVGGMSLAHFFANGASAQVIKRAGHALYGSMSKRDATTMLFDGRLRSEQLIGLGAAAYDDSSFAQAQANDGSYCPKCGRQSVLGFSSQIAANQFASRNIDAARSAINSALDKMPIQRSMADIMAFQNEIVVDSSEIVVDRIVNLSSRQFSGHVYNLQTVTGWYVANGIITHNCRCTLIPIVSGMDAPKWLKGEDWLVEQSPETQRDILGKTRYYAWQNGDVTLKDLVSIVPNAMWGDTLRATPLRDLQGLL